MRVLEEGSKGLALGGAGQVVVRTRMRPPLCVWSCKAGSSGRIPVRRMNVSDKSTRLAASIAATSWWPTQPPVHKGAVGGGQRHPAEFVRCNPPDLGVFQTLGIPLDADGSKADDEFGKRIRKRDQRLADGAHRDRQFLSQFPLDCEGVGFARLAFSTGKLPQPAVPFVERPAANEHAVLPGDDCGHHADCGAGHHQKIVRGFLRAHPVKSAVSGRGTVRAQVKRTLI